MQTARRIELTRLPSVEVWSARLVESDDFAVDNRVFGTITERFDNERELMIEKTRGFWSAAKACLPT